MLVSEPEKTGVSSFYFGNCISYSVDIKKILYVIIQN